MMHSQEREDEGTEIENGYGEPVFYTTPRRRDKAFLWVGAAAVAFVLYLMFRGMYLAAAELWRWL